MSAVITVIHLLIAVAMIGVILIQKSEGGGLGMGGGGMSGFMTGRSTANLLTRTTAILAAGFFATSVGLAIINGHHEAPSIIETPAMNTPPQQPAPAAPASTPAAPSGPSVPLAK